MKGIEYINELMATLSPSFRAIKRNGRRTLIILNTLTLSRFFVASSVSKLASDKATIVKSKKKLLL